MNAVESPITAAIRDNHPALIGYLTAGDPTIDRSKRYIESLERGGADVIEVGLPFSEPIAEGPTIQGAIDRALDAGMTTERYFEFIESLDVTAPVLVMTYYNLILQYGDSTPVEAFVKRASSAGIDGIIVPDLPAEESSPLKEACDAYGLDLVFILAPTTTDTRLDGIMSRASGFVYVQARLGTTGAREQVDSATHESLQRLRSYDIPKAVGFGISSGDQAAEITRAGADGVIVGSAFIDLVSNADKPASRLESLASEIKAGAIRGKRERTEPEHP